MRNAWALWVFVLLAYRGKSTIPTSSKLELFYQLVMTSWHCVVAECSIIDDVGVWDPPQICFSVQNSNEKIKI